MRRKLPLPLPLLPNLLLLLLLLPLDWWRHKEIDPWIIPCIIKSQSQIPADIWDATPSTTNTNEAQHHWTNSLTGTKLTPVEALESRRRVDQNVADEIKMSLKTGILSNSNNELSHWMARNSQRQSAVARRATESRDAANVSKDLQRRIDEEAEKRRLSNETTKFLKAQLKDAKASSSGHLCTAFKFYSESGFALVRKILLTALPTFEPHHYQMDGICKVLDGHHPSAHPQSFQWTRQSW
ncbi:hypothetical protein B0H10DRAFT_1947447 [Mycena sp. CBHHK59/15]|nr:hypothetical protein B0H10DRAFT_1947447 [Mycena sp. CBHHK59/15]